ncbi:hypothetical protein RDV89_02960 [Nocardioides zeae]|uniref:Uncharacterized protein n=1 Tax=Nocardioides imazamoxiresistens TaxID=3231893 RepID=A0ABU3PS07_9ACTN|nr:hypothetical protein [Nocardioides zeae]MDT9592010.1 hypothetical protein [Nocardioides zeae]
MVVRVRRVGRMDRSGLPEQLAAVLAPYGERNAFNPSVLVDGDTVHLVFRAFGPGSTAKPFRAYWTALRRTPDGLEPGELVDLTAHAAAHGVGPVADPKLFAHDGRVLVTFNTGFTHPEPNGLGVIALTPTLGPPQWCELEGRARIEKNWAFHTGDDGGLAAIYGLAPLVRLRLAKGVVGSGDALVFERVTARPGADDASAGLEGAVGLGWRRSLSLGSQPVRAGDDLLLVGHEKLYRTGRDGEERRGYVGRLVRVRGERVTVHPDRLVHSWRDARPRPGVHNPRALFVTYFSGLALADDRLLVGYGINDLSGGFAFLDRRYLRP